MSKGAPGALQGRRIPFSSLISHLSLPYWGFKAALWLAARVPRWPAYRLAALGGELYYWTNRSHSRKADENFAVMLADDVGARRVRDTARRAFRNYAKYLFDFFRLPAIDPDAFDADVISEGWEHLDAALARGRGALLVLGHFGNWDLAGALVAWRGYPMLAPVDTFRPPRLDQLIHATRNHAGMSLVPVEQGGALRQIQRALRRNQVVAIVFDRPQREGGVEVDFFGAPAWLPAGPARFALRTGATVLPGYLLRRPGDLTYLARVEEPVAFTPTGDEEADVRAYTQAIVARVEAVLRAYPDQWYMFRRMWTDES